MSEVIRYKDKAFERTLWLYHKVDNLMEDNEWDKDDTRVFQGLLDYIEHILAYLDDRAFTPYWNNGKVDQRERDNDSSIEYLRIAKIAARRRICSDKNAPALLKAVTGFKEV